MAWAMAPAMAGPAMPPWSHHGPGWEFPESRVRPVSVLALDPENLAVTADLAIRSMMRISGRTARSSSVRASRRSSSFPDPETPAFRRHQDDAMSPPSGANISLATVMAAASCCAGLPPSVQLVRSSPNQGHAQVLAPSSSGRGRHGNR